MNSIIGAVALLLAAPAGTQSGAADPHSGHAQHQQQGKQQHGQHGRAGHKDCCTDGKHADCCAKAGRTEAKMACCEHGSADQTDGGHKH